MERKIGLTGGIASGKSSVSMMLARLLGIEHIDADAVCRQLLTPREEGWFQFTKIFGSEFLLKDKTIDRVKMRNHLFADENFRLKVNGIIHPLVRESIIARMDNILESDPGTKVLAEVPLLYEVGWEDMFDTVVVVYADYEVCLKRLMERDALDRNGAEIAMQSQMGLNEKTVRANHVIDNSGSLADTMSQVEHLAQVLGK